MIKEKEAARKFKKSKSKTKIQKIDSDLESSNFESINDSINNLNTSGGIESDKEKYQITLNLTNETTLIENTDQDEINRLYEETLKKENMLKIPDIHEDVQSKLDYIYYNNAMTIISEEPSKKLTEFTVGLHKQSDRISNPSVITWKSNGVNLDKKLNPHLPTRLGNSIDNAVLSNQLKKLDRLKKDRLAQSSFEDRTSTEKVNLSLNKSSKKFLSDIYGNKKRLNGITENMIEKNLKTQNLNLKSQNEKKLSNQKNLKFDKARQPELGNSDDKSWSMLSFNEQSISKLNLSNLLELPSLPKAKSYTIKLLINFKEKSKKYKKIPLITNISINVNPNILYKGNLVFGKLDGKGSLYIQKNSQKNPKSETIHLYEGFFKNSEIEGKGQLFFGNGGKFEGEFKNGLAHGYGRLFKNEESLQIEGVWINGKLC